MKKKITIDPITRIEGHLKIDVEVKDGKVVDAYSCGEMFRGFENILAGRNPVDAQHITQRICGVCPSSHAQASTLNLDAAFGIEPPDNGRLIRNLMLGANFIQSHVLHFYHLAALDYVDITAIAKYKGSDNRLIKLKNWVLNGLKQAEAGEPVALGPFLPRYEGDFYVKDVDVNIQLIDHYLKALDARRLAHEMLTVFGGRMPHQLAIAPGGATQKPTVDKIVGYKMRLASLIEFIDDVYVPDIIALAGLFPGCAEVGKSYGNYLSYGVFEETNDAVERYLPAGVVKISTVEDFDHTKISEHVRFSRFKKMDPAYPHEGKTEPEFEKKKAYSWVKAPRYDGEPMEVGPGARMVVAYMKGHEDVKKKFDEALNKLDANLSIINTAAGRHLARALETSIVAHKLLDYVDQLKPGEPFHTPFSIPDKAKGMGLTEAPRGALGHWILIENGKIANYQAVVPTTWNAGPRDDDKNMGPIEKALMDAPVTDHDAPMEPARIVRSFDPCLACAIHLSHIDKSVEKKTIELPVF